MRRPGEIKVSPKHGLNPSLLQCFYCGKEDTAIALCGYLPGDVEAPRQMCTPKFPCAECEGFMKIGIILVSVKDGESGDNPCRTGGFVVMKESAVRRMFKGPEVEDICKFRFTYIEDKIWDRVGIPRDNFDYRTQEEKNHEHT